MTLSVKHAFTSLKVDGPDSTLLRPSNWNAEHTITLAGRGLIGKTGTGAGAATEIAISADLMTLLQTASMSAFCDALGIVLPTTGDAFLSMRATAPTGWIKINDGTIGNATSNSTTRANADTLPLYTLIWEAVSNTYAPTFHSDGSPLARGASAAADFAAHKRLAIPRMLGRAIAIAGGGAALTSRTIGDWLGTETHTLGSGEVPSLSGTFAGSGTGTTTFGGANPLVYNGATRNYGSATPNVNLPDIINSGSSSMPVTVSVSGLVAVTGGGGTHPNTQPTAFAFNCFMKL